MLGTLQTKQSRAVETARAAPRRAAPAGAEAVHEELLKNSREYFAEAEAISKAVTISHKLAR